MKNSRRLTVSSIIKSNHQIPAIRLAGAWLGKLGFQIGRKVLLDIEPGRIVVTLIRVAGERRGGMAAEGFVLMQHQGRYALFNPGGAYHELRRDDQIAVDTGDGWIRMSVQQDQEGYYLKSKRISFYPKMVYARFLEEQAPTALPSEPLLPK